jgi:hypothetical protein
MKIENRNQRLKKIGVAILSVGVISAAGFGGYKYLVEPNQRVEAQRVADAKEKQVETKTRQITSGIVISDVKAKIEKSLSDGSKLNQEELDRLTYYLYQYTQSGYQFLGTNGDNSNIGMQAFVDLKKLYDQSGLKAPYDYNLETDEITFNRDVQKPKDYDQKIDEVKDTAKEKAEKVADSKDGGVKLESEGIIE